MEPDKLDRRVQRSRELLNAALIDLLHEKRYDLITVQAIIDRANVSRSTFYLHYQDKDDLLASNFEHVLDDLNHHQPALASGELRLLPVLELFRHVQGHRVLYQAIVGGRGMDVLFKAGRAYWARNIEQVVKTLSADASPSPVPLPILTNYITGAFLTLLNWWLDNNLPYPPERMAELFKQLVMPGVRAAVAPAE